MKPTSQLRQSGYGFSKTTFRSTGPIYQLKADRALGPVVNSVVLLTMLIFSIPVLGGCVGAVAQSMTRPKFLTGKTYADVKETLPPPPPGHGRLYVYRTKESTRTELQYGTGLQKNTTWYTVDDTVYDLMWEAFTYWDLPEGQHEITCGSDVVRKADWRTIHFQKGRNRIQCSVVTGSDVYIRFDATKEKPFFQPVLVAAEQAQEELTRLPNQRGTKGFPL